MIARIILVFLCLLQGMALQANELLDVTKSWATYCCSGA